MTVVTILHFLNDSAILHSMSISAMTGPITGREAKKAATLRRIQLRALELTRDRGLDGWTMDELADAAEVSRRTLFNYVPGKVDAVIGSVPEIPDAALATFVGGGPHGVLLDDVGELALHLLDDEDFTPDLVDLRMQVATATPRLMLVAHERFQEVLTQMSGHILAREGKEFGEHRAALLVRLCVAFFDVALQQFSQDPHEAPLSQRFLDALATGRELLGP